MAAPGGGAPTPYQLRNEALAAFETELEDERLKMVGQRKQNAKVRELSIVADAQSRARTNDVLRGINAVDQAGGYANYFDAGFSAPPGHPSFPSNPTPSYPTPPPSSVHLAAAAAAAGGGAGAAAAGGVGGGPFAGAAAAAAAALSLIHI